MMNRSLSAALLVSATTVACGSPFETRTLPDASDAAPDRAEVDADRHDAHTDHNTPEAGPDVVDAGPDVVEVVDSGPDALGDAGPDAGPDAPEDADGGCGPTLPSPPVYGVTSTAQYGISLNGAGTDTGSPTPTSCRCASTYTCLCLETTAPTLDSLCTNTSYTHFASCFMSGVVPVVECSP